MNITEFKQLMDSGRGGAVLYLQSHPADPYREALLHGCLHNTAYDPQSEGVRGDYLFDLIQTTGQAGFYRDRVLAALNNGDFESNRDEAWCFDLARVFAQHGDTAIREAMYGRFTQNVRDEDNTGAESLIALDGWDGFLYVTNALGVALLSEPDFWGDTQFLFGVLEARYGEEQSHMWLDEVRVNNPQVEALMQARGGGHGGLSERVNTLVGLPYADVRARLLAQQGQPSFGTLARWGKKASQADFEQAAHDFLSETDAARLTAYLAIFAKRAFPLEPQRLMELVFEADKRVAWLAAGTLAQVQHTAVRAVALRLLEDTERQREGVRILCGDFQETDLSLIERVLRGSLDAESLHSIGIEIRNVFKAHPSADNVPILLLLYEKGPCSMCRKAYIEMLLALNALPEWVRAECQYDANLEIRALFHATG